MKTSFCSFCRTQQDLLFGMNPKDPESYSICGNCLYKFSAQPAKKVPEGCSFCAVTDKPGYFEESSGAVICEDCVPRLINEIMVTPAPARRIDDVDEVMIDWPMYLDSSMDMITVRVKLRDGTILAANLTTPQRVAWEMEKGKRSGDWSNGICFFHPDLVFVEDLSEDIIRKAVSHLSKNDLLKKAFKPEPQ